MLNLNNIYDEGIYRAANPDVDKAVMAGVFRSGLEHFQASGQFEGRKFSASFDSSYYLAQNPDLAAVPSKGKFSSIEHFLQQGQFEGRNPNPLFNTEYYLNTYSDIAAAVKAKQVTAFEHFLKSGQSEGRDPSIYLNTRDYLSLNADVADAVAKRITTAYKHYLENGLKEGRQGSILIDIKYYLSLNTDVAKAFGNDMFEALMHLDTSGMNEKRVFSPIVDLDLYRAFNSDLSKLNSKQALLHLQNFGIREGREFSHAFDLDYYGSNNPDLLTDYAVRNQLRIEAVLESAPSKTAYNEFLVKHFMTSGIREGRRSSDEFDVEYYKQVNPDLAKLSNEQLYQHFRSFGLGEARKFSDSYDAAYYSEFNSAPNGLKLQQLFEYYILDGKSNGENGSENEPLQSQVVRAIDLTGLKGVSKTINGTLSSSASNPNEYRQGTFAEGYILDGLLAGQEVTISMNASFDTYLQLVNPFTEEIITFNDNIATNNTNSEIKFTVEEDAVYKLIATSVDARGMGNFTITATTSSATADTITPATAFNGNLTTSDRLNPNGFYSYSKDYAINLSGVAAEQKIKVNLASQAFDTVLEIVDTDTGYVLASNDDANTQITNSELFFIVETGSNYVARVSSKTSDASGNFSLTASVVPGTSGKQSMSMNAAMANTPSISTNEQIAGKLATGDTSDIYDITGVQTGQKIKISLDSNDFDTLLTITDGNGTTISTNDDADATRSTNSELTFTAAAGTAYKITVQRAAKDTKGLGAYNLSTTLLDNSVSLSTPELQNVIANKQTLERSDILSLFNETTKDNTISSTEISDLKSVLTNAERFNIKESHKFLLERVVNGLPNTPSVQQFTNLVDTWFKGTKRPSPSYTGKGDSARGQQPEKTVQFTYLPIQGSLFGNVARSPVGVRGRDINQGGIGNCAYLAALDALIAVPRFQGSENTTSTFLNQSVENNGDGTYTIRFFNQGKAFYVTIDNQVATTKQDNNDTLYMANRGGVSSDSSTLLSDDNNSIWGPLMEKAYAQFREFLQGSNGKQTGYDLIGNGAQLNETLEYVTGRKVDYIGSEEFKQVTFDRIKTALQQGRSITVGTDKATPLLVATHAFALTAVREEANGSQRIVVRNPWGRDGGSQASGVDEDGYIELTFENFIQSFDDMAIA
jgi:Calpain family cysteine protease/Bacterial pre-peptidase C-terminal domain